MSRLAIAVCAMLAVPSTARAQFVGREVPHTGTVEISGGGFWSSGYTFEAAQASETRNPTTGSSPLTLFQAKAGLEGGTGAEAHLGVYLGRRVSIEGGMQFSRSSLAVRATGDFENAPDTTVSSRISQYVFDGTILYHFGAGRLTPFASVGGGYLRQVLEGSSTVETGNEAHGAGGVKYWFGARRRFGIRAEARASSRSGGIRLDASTKRRIVATASGGLAYLF